MYAISNDLKKKKHTPKDREEYTTKVYDTEFEVAAAKQYTNAQKEKENLKSKSDIGMN